MRTQPFRPSAATCLRRIAVTGGWLVCAARLAAAVEVVTNVSQLAPAAGGPLVAHTLDLVGDIWWANPVQGRLVLQDASGAEALELELAGEFPQAGQRVRLEGSATISRRGPVLRLGVKGAVVDNDGAHGMIEAQGAAYLRAGWQPIRLEWFNGVEGRGLEVKWAGPGFPKQGIPDSALGQGDDLLPGLAVRCFEATGSRLPDFARLRELTNGSAANFSLPPLPRPEHIGVEFSGRLHVPAAGLYTFHLTSDDGSRLFVGQPTLVAHVVGAGTFPPPQRLTIGQPLTEAAERRWSELEGRVAVVRHTETGWQLDLVAGAAHLVVELGDAAGFAPASWVDARIRAAGFAQGVRTPDDQSVVGVLRVPNQRHLHLIESPVAMAPRSEATTNFTALAVLTTAREVHQLKREEAQRAYPVRLRGVVTCVLPEHQSFTLHDATRGLYIQDFSPTRATPEIGDYVELEGTTDPSLFAPIVRATRVRSLGGGRLPEPIKPMWDQLNNGSLDAQSVELEGIVTASNTDGLTLLARGGVIHVALRLRDHSVPLSQFANALVRIRGCLFASWDYLTHQVKMGDVRLYAADILIDQPAPADLFASPRKSAAELLQFDPQAGVFQRVMVSGQIVHARGDEYFLMAGERGLRLFPQQPVALQRGDLVDVVGFPDLFGLAAPVLREAVVRRSGHAPLPSPRVLTTENLVHADHDATPVSLRGTLLRRGRAEGDTILELQNGVRTFIARLEEPGDALSALAPGSLLELTGVYAGVGGNRAAGREIATFELLLRSPADLKVLARPPWWTLKRLLVIVGALACVLAAAALWIHQLHRQVEERTLELGAQIQARQRVEQQRALETERTRIAQDLHDELGSGITEMSMLAARARAAAAVDDKRERHLEQVGGKARELVTALDEIVWAMNPRHDSLSSLVSYFSLYAERFLGLANIAWKLDGPGGLAEMALDSRRRHQLFLAFKEALTNVVRHAAATEVQITIQREGGSVRLTVRDNGRGLSAEAPDESRQGLANMRARIEKLGGRFELSSAPGHGTTVRLTLPVEGES